MNQVAIWEEEIVIPTYEAGNPEKEPVFLENRVYQGASGKVYPYPIIEKISDEKKDKTYRAVFLENEYLKIMILPELGGRIQRAYDKTNGYDFVYYNQVIKPALVGLLGPWISGGIEFNWPQHHRPTTYMPVDYKLQENKDGSKTVLLHDTDQMFGTQVVTKISLYPGKAYVEIEGQLYNGTSVPQTFLWWANPAVTVNDYTKSIFPPDVHAVMDHGKRDVSRFPIATGVYYKHDYSEGVDISRYKNIPVPTSYMAEKSKYDFVGGYDFSKEAGILHVADHHISPGKKQWTWGCGDFGKAWDRNLTDEDGPYIELMTGVYTDNQPDFTWLMPFEEKRFKQYFMPYKKAGEVKNASIHAIMNLEVTAQEVSICVYATEKYEDAKIIITNQGRVVSEDTALISPVDIFEKKLVVSCEKASDIKAMVYHNNELLVEYQPEDEKIEKIPEPAKAAKNPNEIMTNEELYLTGLHIEQYHHATYLPDPYYLEALKRDEGDIRVNNAYGKLMLKRGCFAEAKQHFEKAINRATWKNPNPYNSECYYNLGLVLYYEGDYDKAYDAFFKSIWSKEQQDTGYYYLAAIDTIRKDYEKALHHIKLSLTRNTRNVKARSLMAYLLRILGNKEECKQWILENLKLDSFDYVSAYELYKLTDDSDLLQQINAQMRNVPENYLMTARNYAEFGAYEESIEVLRQCTNSMPLLYYYEAYYLSKQKMDCFKALEKADLCVPDYCFPNKLEDIAVLEHAIKEFENGGMAYYYLGNLYYDKMQYKRSVKLWEKAAKLAPDYGITYRNLALAYYNKFDKKQEAQEMLEKAFALMPNDSRIFLELDQMYKKRKQTAKFRLDFYEKNKETFIQKDALYIEYVTLLNLTGQFEQAYSLIMERRFHPWEGGEGRVINQYKISLVEQAKRAIDEKKYEVAENFLKKALVYPENLGEGKLEGAKDNNIYYYLGVVSKALSKDEDAHKFFTAATMGAEEPAGVMYYYDQPADMILYQGLALKELGQTGRAKAKFAKLLDYGEEHIFDQVKIEYFAVSLPDLMVFDEDLNRKNKAHCYYLMGLSKLGSDDKKGARENFSKTMELEPFHQDAINYYHLAQEC